MLSSLVTQSFGWSSTETRKTNNNSAIALSKNHVSHQKNKHINTKYHFIKKILNNGEIQVELCESNDQLAHIFTKPLTKNIFEINIDNLDIVKAEVVICYIIEGVLEIVINSCYILVTTYKL